MGHDDVALGYPISTGFRRLTGCQQDPRVRGVTDSISNFVPVPNVHNKVRIRLMSYQPVFLQDFFSAFVGTIF